MNICLWSEKVSWTWHRVDRMWDSDCKFSVSTKMCDVESSFFMELLESFILHSPPHNRSPGPASQRLSTWKANLYVVFWNNLLTQKSITLFSKPADNIFPAGGTTVNLRKVRDLFLWLVWALLGDIGSGVCLDFSDWWWLRSKFGSCEWCWLWCLFGLFWEVSLGFVTNFGHKQLTRSAGRETGSTSDE